MPAAAANSHAMRITMPDTFDISCPNCGKRLKVPAHLEGKKLKCKDCQEVFPVKAPKAGAAPAAKPAPPPPAAKPPNPFLDDDDDDDVPGKAAKPMNVVHEEDVPRCPHCAKELDPPDAIICVHCGYNNRTRVKAETKKVYAAEATDWMSHLGPAILLLIVALVLIGVDIYCAMNMRSWLEGSALELDEKDLTGRKKMIIPPGAFIAFIVVISMAIVIPCMRFALRRLIFNFKPEEKIKK
jgi:hypothetical protein